MENANRVFSDSQIISFLSNLSKLILTDKDCYDEEEIIAYIEKLEDKDKHLILNLGSEYEKLVHSVLFVIVTEYLDSYVPAQSSNDMNGSPFIFDSAGNYHKFRMYFERSFNDLIGTETLPYIFNCAFDYVQNISEHFRVFEKFYAIRSRETAKVILLDTKREAEQVAKECAEEAVDAAIENVNEHTCQAQVQAQEASFQAELAKEQAKKAKEKAENAAKEAVELAVERKMADVTSHVSENSVTILGIFSGIVLAVVAGLFYSSSVLESVNSANFFRLSAVACLVGLVCYHLIALMFRSIEKIKGTSTSLSNLSDLDKVISAILVVLIIVSSILQFVVPFDEKNETEPSQSTTYIYTTTDDDESTSYNPEQTTKLQETTIEQKPPTTN